MVAKLGRRLWEVPVGFKWFSPGLFDGSCCFGGEESAGASFLRRDGTVWTTDKDGILLALLAAEITAVDRQGPRRALPRADGRPGHARATRGSTPRPTPAQKARLRKLAPADVRESTLAGEPILAKLTRAPGNDAPIGGLKVATECGWFAARPSGTEDVYKLYAESFQGPAHLAAIVAEAKQMVGRALGGVGR